MLKVTENYVNNMDELERLSSELKLFLTKYDKRIILGHFTQLMETSSLGIAQDE